MANISMHLWGYDLLEQWKTQTYIFQISEKNHKIKNASELNIKSYYQEESQTIHVVRK